MVEATRIVYDGPSAHSSGISFENGGAKTARKYGALLGIPRSVSKSRRATNTLKSIEEKLLRGTEILATGTFA
jgi:hypothetical protein